jgi:NTE family protein
VSLRGRLVAYDTFVPNSEWRVDGAVGTSLAAAIELYKRVGHTGFFVAPRAYALRTTLNAYTDEGEFLAEYREKRVGAGIDVGYTTGQRSEVRAGFDQADVRVRLRVGAPALPEATGSDQFASVRYVFDGQDSPTVPSRGLRVRTVFRYYFETPDLVVGDEDTAVQQFRDVPLAEVSGSWFTRVAPKYRFFVSAGAGTSFDSNPGMHLFRLGGPMRLGAFNNGEVLGRHYMLGVAGLLREWFRLPDILGGNVYAGGWVEQGSAYDAWEDAAYRGAASGGVIAETLLGPVFVGYSHSLTGSDSRYYVALAPLLP